MTTITSGATTSTTTYSTAKFLLFEPVKTSDIYNGIPVTVETTITSDEDQDDLRLCKRYGHTLLVLDHYGVPTGDLYCTRCFGTCPDPDYDHDEAMYLAWQHWPLHRMNRRTRFRYWLRSLRERVS